ncbi:MAG: zinc-ribbon domain-containing protein [Candidatus Hodarchaeota archaeon]
MSPYCTNCGTELEESWNACPNCGKTLKQEQISQSLPQQQPYIPTQPQAVQVQPYHRTYRPSGSNTYGIAALICGLIGLVLSFTYGAPVLGLAAIVLGGLGISRDDNNAMAMIGVILGIVDFVFFLLFYFLFFSIFNWFNWFNWFDWLD